MKCEKIKKSLISKLRYFIYFFVFVCSIVALSLSFCNFDPKWLNVWCGVGSGLLTSLVVTLIINAENSAREKRRLKAEKHLLLNNIVEISIDVYDDIVYRINEYLTLSKSEISNKYELYADFKVYNEVEKHLKSLDFESLSEDEKERLERLFNIGSYKIDYLISELKSLPKNEYLLRGILTEKEYKNLVPPHILECYLNYSEHIDEFWLDEILDLEKCIKFLRLTLLIVTKTISTFDYALKKTAKKEESIKEDISHLYFDEIYCKSDDYAIQQFEEQEAKMQYFAENPDEYQKSLEAFETTTEDRVLSDLYCSLVGFSISSVEDLLNNLDPNSENVKKFILNNYGNLKMKEKMKLKKALRSKYGKKYFQKIMNEENNHGQT